MALERVDDQLKRQQASNKTATMRVITAWVRRYHIRLEELIAIARRAGWTQEASTLTWRKADARHTVAPKYRHPETGETWTGRGRPARWLAEAEAAGFDRSQFLICRDDRPQR
ncbi:H-NS histone family protein [Streptomyces cavourensis]|nr:H-NS histone family protein [Streptomyces cavourensis]